jgi:hypothetical protein
MRSNRLDLVMFTTACLCGCGGGGGPRGARTADTPLTCGIAAVRIFDTMSLHAASHERDDLAQRREETLAIARYTCNTDAWSHDVIACFVAAPSEPALTACSAEMTVEQRAGFASRILLAFELAKSDARAAAN